MPRCIKRSMVTVIVMLWPVMPRRARLWAFMNENNRERESSDAHER
jgi:hypothetical protein